MEHDLEWIHNVLEILKYLYSLLVADMISSYL